MNICLVMFSDAWSGAENVVHELARFYVERGNNVSLILNSEVIRFYRDLDGVHILDVGPLYNSRNMLRAMMGRKIPTNEDGPDLIPMDMYVKMAMRRLLYQYNARKVKTFMERERVEVVHLHLEECYRPMIRYCRPLRIPLVITLHSPFLKIGTADGRTIRRAVRKRSLTKVLNRIDGLTYQCQGDIDSMKVLSPPATLRPALVPNGVDVATAQKYRRSTKGHGAFKLVYAGGSRWQKGGTLAVRTLAELRRKGLDITMDMLGTIPSDHEITNLIKELGLEDHIVMGGFVPFPQVYQHLAVADIILIPSVSEGFPVLAVEAMALGKAIVGTKVGGIPAALEDGRNALLVPPDPQRLAEAIQRLYERPEEIEQMETHNLEDVKRFDWGAVTEQYLAYFASLAPAPDPPKPSLLAQPIKKDLDGRS